MRYAVLPVGKIDQIKNLEKVGFVPFTFKGAYLSVP